MSDMITARRNIGAFWSDEFFNWSGHDDKDEESNLVDLAAKFLKTHTDCPYDPAELCADYIGRY